MQPFGEIFSVAQMDLAGAVLVLGLVTLAVVARLNPAAGLQAGAESAQTVVWSVEPASPPRAPAELEWERITEGAYAHVAHAVDLPALQARAALQVDAAEHALARLLADCASIGCHFGRPPETVLRMAPQALRTVSPQSLAA